MSDCFVWFLVIFVWFVLGIGLILLLVGDFFFVYVKGSVVV